MTFVDEVAEHIDSINSAVLKLESDSSGDARENALTDLFRAAHSLKGAARAVDVPPIEQICHLLEDVFSRLRDGQTDLTSSVASAILSAADRIGDAGNALRSRQPLPEDFFAASAAMLQAIAEGSNAADSDVSVTDVQQPGASAKENEAEQSKNVLGLVPATSKGATVRVAEAKLDGLLAQAGELLTARQRLEIRPDEIESLTDDVAACRAEFLTEFRTASDASGVGADSIDATTTAQSLNTQYSVADRLRQLEKNLEAFHQRLLADVRQLSQASDILQQDIHRIRMQPFQDGCAGLDRAVRDVAVSTGKQVELVIEGGDIEVDRKVLEGLRDPLLHLIRNAVDHGLESPAERSRFGKNPTGQVLIKVAVRGSQVDISVSDDGRGLDRDAVRAKVIARHLPEPRDEQELLRCIFLPGFSTAKLITDVSGRGVGLDVVKSQLERLHGTIDIKSEPGLGTRFSLSVPLTLTTIAALFVKCCGRTYAIPSTNISRLLRFRAEELTEVGGQKFLSPGGPPVPVTTLSSALGIRNARSNSLHGFLHGAVLTTGDRELVVLVDELIGERQAVLKSLGSQIQRSRLVSAATLLRNGEIALLLNVSTIIRDDAAWNIDETVEESVDGTKRSRRILVVDDSMTTRALLKNVVLSGGYEVSTSHNGQDAWEKLQRDHYDLLVSDVDMPVLNGFELTTRIRASESHGRIPVILVTSRDSEADRANGVTVGADAYLVKSSFEQSTVLATIEQLL